MTQIDSNISNSNSLAPNVDWPLFRRLAILLFFFLLAACRETKQTPRQAFGKKNQMPLQIGLIPGPGNPSDWEAFYSGAKLAAKLAKGIQIVWAPITGIKVYEPQIRALLHQIEKKVDGIIISPIDQEALLAPLEQAGLAGIPVISIGPPINNKGIMCFLTTQTAELARLAAREAGKLLDGEGYLLILMGDKSSPSHTVIDSVFDITIRSEFPEITILQDSMFTGETVEQAFLTAENLLIRFPQVEAVLCPSLAATKGMLKALKDIDMAGKIKIVGCGADESIALALIEGEIHAAVSPNFHQMGYQSLALILRIIGKRQYEKINQAHINIITQKNVLDTAIQAWLSPKLD